MMTAATMLFASSCSKEQISTTVPVGEEVTVTLTADLGAIESRAIADGLKINEVAWAIYTEGATSPLGNLQGVLPISNKKGTLEVRLVTGRKYDIALFAYYSKTPAEQQVNGGTPTPYYYQVDWNNKSFSVLYPDGYIANENDARDCFWHVEESLEVDGPINTTFTLHRPLAQLNFGVSKEDTLAAANAGLTVGSTKIVATTYNTFNMFTCECSDSQTITFDKNTVPNQTLTVEDDSYTYIGTTYLLVGDNGTDKMIQDVKLTVYDDADAEIYTYGYKSVPFQRNFRTNILGALLTKPAEFVVKIDEQFNKPDFDIKYWAGESTAITPDANGVYNVTTPAELAWIAEQVNSGKNDFAGKQIVIKETDAILDLNGDEYNWTPIGTAGKPFKGSFDGNNVVIRNMKVNVPEYAGLFGNVVSDGITNVKIEDAVIESSHYAGAIAGYAYSDITYCTVDGLTMTVLPNDTTRAAFDNGDKAGGIVGYVGEDGYKINNNTVKNAIITAYRDLGGVAGAAYIAECTKNKVSDTTLTVDQETNHYGFKKANLGKIVGRVLGGTVGTNYTYTSLKLVWKPADLEYLSVEDAIKLKSGSVKVKGWAVAKCAKGFVMTDESNALIYVYNPKSYPELGARIMVSGSAGTYGDSKLTQIGSGCTVTLLEGEPVEVTYPTVEKAMTVAEIDAYYKANTRMYTKIKGKLIVSGNFVNIDAGASVQGSAMYPDDDLKALAKTLDGETVYVEGYAVYTYNSYLHICTTKIYDAKELTKWGVCGDMTGWGANPDIPMYTYGDGIAFAKGVEVAKDQGFKIRIPKADGSWDDNYNIGTNDVKVYSNMPVPVYTGGGSGNLYPTEAGTYDIYFDIVNLDKVYVMTAGTPIDEALPYEKYEEPQLDKHTWRIVGGFNGWNEADDKYLMTLTDDNKWATIVAEFASNTELKFVANGEWAINRGNGVTVELDKEYAGYKDGGNIKVPAGKYFIKLNMCDGRFVFKEPIEKVEETITFNSKDKRTEYSTTKQVWVEGDITVTNEKGSSTSNVGDYAYPARFYKNSKLVVSVPGNMSQIVFDCNSTKYATALKNSIKTGGTVTVASDKVTVVLDTPANSFVIPALTADQVRMDGLTVTYMKELK